MWRTFAESYLDALDAPDRTGGPEATAQWYGSFDERESLPAPR